jgi:RimJ/RimL family protein N-acetyltransferase
VRPSRSRFDLDRIEASAHPENAASFAVMRACGLTFRREMVVVDVAGGIHEGVLHRGANAACITFELCLTAE